MQRENGYYWVRFYENTAWETAYWCGLKWWIVLNDEGYNEKDLFEVNESRILNPDEKDAAIPSINGFDLLDTVLRNAQRTGSGYIVKEGDKSFMTEDEAWNAMCSHAKAYEKEWDDTFVRDGKLEYEIFLRKKH
jgi:hypothetical protein